MLSREACSAVLVEYFLYKIPLKNKGGVFTLKVLLNEIALVAAVKIRIGRLLQAFPPSEPYVRLSPHTARTLSQLPLWLLVAGCFARPASCWPSEARAKNLRLGCWDVAVAEPMVTSLRKIL